VIGWTVAGWLGNACFFSRFLVQWALSERARRSVAPPIFWWISLAGSLLLGSYALHTGRPILLAGFAVNGAIYARNLWIRRFGGRTPAAALWCAGAAALLLTVTAASRTAAEATLPWGWIACGVLGQAAWSSRFVVQWIASERRGESHFPPVFWRLSLFGNALLLAYALRLGDAVFIAGLVPGPLVQLRNLALGRRVAAAGVGVGPDEDHGVAAG